MEVRFNNGLRCADFEPLNIKNGNSLNTPKFLGLSKAARKHIFLEPKLLQQISGVNNSEIIGEPPVEFIRALKETDSSKEKIGQDAKKLMKSFSMAASVLREAEKSSFCGKDFQVLEFARMLDETASVGSPLQMQNCFQRLLRMQASQSTFAPVLDEASVHIDKAFKETGVLPKDGKASLEFISEGGRGYAFKVSFLDNEGKKVFHDKILKLYRSPMKEVAGKIAKTVHDYTNVEPEKYFELCKGKMSEYYAAHINELPNYYNLSPKDLVDITVDDYMLSVEAFQRQNWGKSYEELFEKYNDFVNEFVGGDIDHGVCAEANRAEYIKNRVGNIRIADYIEPCFFNLKTGFSVFDASDDELPKIKKKVDLGKYGLHHYDLEYNPGNIVKGRVIDYGGIGPGY